MEQASKDELKIFDRAVAHVRSKPSVSEEEGIRELRRGAFIAGYRAGYLDGQTEATTRTSELPQSAHGN